jgi:hypothetical protein
MQRERVSVPEAVRRTGVRGDRIFLAIRHGEISTAFNERGLDQVVVEEVLTLAEPQD